MIQAKVTGMHVVGARFRTLADAGAALLAIRSAVTVAPGDVAVRPLGSTRYENPAEDFLLAGRFDDGEVDTVVAIVAARGGQLLERRREQTSRATATARPRGPQASLASNPPWSAPWAPSAKTKGKAPASTNRTRSNLLAGAKPRSPRPAARLPLARPGARLRRPAALLRIRAARSHRSGWSNAQ